MLPEHVMKFAKNGNSLYVAFQDLYNQFVSENYGEKKTYQKVDSEGLPIDFAEKEKRVNEALLKEILAVGNFAQMEHSKIPLASFATNPTFVWATYAVVSALIDAVVPQAIVDSIGMYTEVRNLAWGDTAAWDIEPRDLFVVSKAGRAKTQAYVRKQYKG